jgi:hypothetical protein
VRWRDLLDELLQVGEVDRRIGVDGQGTAVNIHEPSS